MYRDFHKWVNDIKEFTERRVGKYAAVWVDDLQSYEVISIWVEFKNGMKFGYSFCRIEFEKNNYRGRRNLAKSS